MKPVLKYFEEKKERKNFYASDFNKLGIDILLELANVPKTNETSWTDTNKWAAGKGVELNMVKILKANGIVSSDFDQEEVPSTRIEREGVTISMKFDAIAKEDCVLMGENPLIAEQADIKKGEPIEIKTINNKNAFDIQEYIAGNPRENYVGQLATYIDALGVEKGHLFASSIDGLHSFWFTCTKVGEGKYQAGNTIVDLGAQYKRYAKIAKMHNDFEIDWFEETYKLPIDKIDWTKLSQSAISDARTNKKVIGSTDSWKIMYSSYRDLILKKQGVTRGYTDEEIAKICEMTKGYSSKKVKEPVQESLLPKE